VPASEIEQRSLSSMCRYSWGKHGEAQLGFITVSRTPADARARFDRAYAGMSGEEVAAHMKTIGDKADKKLEDDKAGTPTPADPKTAKKVAGKVGGALAAGFKYEPVEGLGDKALWDATRREHEIAGRTIVSYSNELKILVSNMYLSLKYRNGPAAEEYREPARKLADAVVAALP